MRLALNRVLTHLGCQYPIIQSPMGWIARASLASAVCNAGGFGMIETSSGEVENCLAEIHNMAELTDQPFGVNLPLMLLNNPTTVEQVINAGVKFVTTSAGDPSKYIHTLKAAGIIVYHSVASLKLAEKAIKAGVDGLIVEGHEGGGFKNPAAVSTLVLLRAIRRKSDIPMVAAGGIADGFSMAAAFAAGAEGIQMGTRFVCSKESPVHDNYKNAIAAARDEETRIINTNSKPWMRVLKTDHSATIEQQGSVENETLAAIQKVYFGGEMNASIAFAGQSVAMIDSIDSVDDIIQTVVQEFFDAQQAASLRFTEQHF